MLYPMCFRGLAVSRCQWLARKTPLGTPISRDYLQKRPGWRALYVYCV